jgi:hypothetical protein
MPEKSDYILTLEAAICTAHDVWPTHRGTFLIREETEDNVVVWDGPVELFGLPNYPGAENCYAWQHTGTDGNVKILAVLESGFVNSPKRAVQAAIFMDVQPALSHRANAVELFKKNLQEGNRIRRETQIKAEDLDAAVQSVRETMERIRAKFNQI